MIKSDYEREKIRKRMAYLDNNPVVNVITIIVMSKDQKWFWFENGSYRNELPLSTFDQAFVHSVIHKFRVRLCDSCSVVICDNVKLHVLDALIFPGRCCS
jgi:hypothetical protein